MPPMRLFGRRWAVGSDDFVFPALTEACIRLCWLLLTVCIFAIRSPTACEARHSVDVYIVVIMVHNVILIIHCFHVAYVSSRGTVYNAIPRRKMARLLYIRCALFLMDVVLAVTGSVIASEAAAMSTCSTTFLIFLNLAVTMAWLMAAIAVMTVWLTFDPLGRLQPDDLQVVHLTPQVWRSRLHRAFCCFSRDERSRTAFEDAAELISQLFGDADLVFTDIWAGLLLLADKHNTVLRNRELRCKRETSVPEWMQMSSAARYIQFALGAYGWLYYICNSTLSFRSLFRLLRRLRFCYHCRCDHVLVIRDNCCLCNMVAFMLQTDLAEPDLFYVNYSNEVWETPFVACVDHSSRSIVIAIRGSMSLRDAFTNLCVKEDTVDVEVQSVLSDTTAVHKAYVHRGILNSARYVQEKLISENIVDDLFVLYPEYGFVVTGHSLGGGVAAVLSLLLKPKYPMVHCFSFSPPGCVIDEVTNEYMKSFVCTVIVGDDLISRMSYHSMLELKGMVREALEQCNRPKYELLVRGCFRWLFYNPRQTYKTLDEEGSYGSPSTPTSSNAGRTLDVSERLITLAKPTYSGDTNGPQCRPKLSCPGQVFHLIRGYASRGVLEVHVCDSNDFREIVLSSSMITDHMPHSVMKALRSVSIISDI